MAPSASSSGPSAPRTAGAGPPARRPCFGSWSTTLTATSTRSPETASATVRNTLPRWHGRALVGQRSDETAACGKPLAVRRRRRQGRQSPRAGRRHPAPRGSRRELRSGRLHGSVMLARLPGSWRSCRCWRCRRRNMRRRCCVRTAHHGGDVIAGIWSDGERLELNRQMVSSIYIA